MASYIFKVFSFLVIFVYVNCKPCTEIESLNITDGLQFPNGSIIYENVEYINGTWYNKTVEDVMLKFGCPCLIRPCIWKCCDEGQAFFDRSCEMTDDPSVNPFSPQVFQGDVPVFIEADKHFFFMHGIPCDDRYLLDSSESDFEMFIQDNGTLYELGSSRPQWHVPSLYCVDMMMRNTTVLVAAVCVPKEVEEDSPVLYIAYAIGLLLSVPFLLATFLVYALIPELRNLHGMCLMAYCGGLIVAYVFLAYLKLHSGEVGVDMTGCLVIAFFIYYAFQTSFFWLNAMCFDIWRTFSGYRGGSTSKRRERRRFAFYGLYAWGVPMLLLGFTLLMQLNDDIPSYIVRPQFGTRRCWFDRWLSELLYFFTPVLILVISNTVLFAITANKIRSIRQETAILKNSESARSDRLNKDKQRFGLYLKLFIVMGVNWTIEIISFAVGGSNWYWVIVDVSNIALGIFIFIIFVWKNKVRNLLLKRIHSFRGVRSTTDAYGTGRWATRSTESTGPTEDTRISADDSATFQAAPKMTMN